MRALSVINKVDNNKDANRVGGAKLFHPSGGIEATPIPLLYISAEKDIGLEDLKEKMWDMLEFINIYLVRQDEEPSFNNPVVMKKGQMLSDLTQEIGTEFAEGKTRAKIWGTGAKFSGQEVSLSTPLQDGMQVRFI